ncbi:DEAD/DEAH box helicase family protein [Mesorhizobium sp. M0991]|uniref:DEAD/DEAH box helicase family protein n=1 Tax=Mesorhizobium sp. M0991 TaxID=2957043 RepID=UPI0033381BFF
MDKFKFGDLKKSASGEKPTKPKDIFGRRPSGLSGIKELWQGQAYALDEWFKVKDKSSLISMYTGAGKTLVGVLIAQSYANQGYANVVYACPTIDLIHQTVKEAKSIGSNPTTYFDRTFSDDNFEQGKSFCVTTYQALLPARTKFKGTKAPSAIIFDDAHVGERLVRDAFTITAHRSKHPELFAALAAEIRQIFDEDGTLYNYQHAMAEDSTGGGVQLVPPVGVLRHADPLQQILKDNIKDSDTSNVLSADYLRGRLSLCAITISKTTIEVTPPFLPALFMPILEDNSVPKIFLSATIHSKADIIRAFGRSSIIIEPTVDAGRGERVLLFGSAIPEFARNPTNIETLSQRHKVLVAVPNAKKALIWQTVVTQASSDADFTARLNAFRRSHAGAFILVGRYDGIDLPDDQCRIMLVDGLPVGTTQLERFSFDVLKLDRAFMSTIANRITQLFGRINRGKTDFGVYIVPDREVENWLRNVRNMTNFPRILQEQIKLSEFFNDSIKGVSNERILSIVDQIIDRDPEWIDYYESHINNQTLDDNKIDEREAENKIDDLYAKKETRFILKMWQGDVSGALAEFEGDRDGLSQINPRLHGWYSVWIGIAHQKNGDEEASYDWFDEARRKLGARVSLPRRPRLSELNPEKEKTFFEEGLRRLLILERPKMTKEIGRITELVAPAFVQSDHKLAEEGIRQLGSTLGFDARRPCTDHGTGPDGIWIDHYTKTIIGFELKNEKLANSEVSKTDVGQCHDHIEWINTQFSGYELVGLVIYTAATRISEKANPSPNMHLVNFDKVKRLWNDFPVLLGDMSRQTLVESFAMASKFGESPEWTTRGILTRLIS